MSTPPPDPPRAFPPRLTGWDAAQAVAAHLAMWLPVRPATGQPGAGTYLYDAARRRGLDVDGPQGSPILGRDLLPTSIEPAAAFRQRAEDRAPFVRVVPGPAEPIDRDEVGVSMVEYTVMVFTVAVEETARRTTDLVTCYEDSVIACIEQQRVAGTTGAWWLGGDGDEEPDQRRERERTRQARVDVFVVHLPDAVAFYGGPASPDDPWPAGYEALDVDVDVQALPAPDDPDVLPQEEP